MKRIAIFMMIMLMIGACGKGEKVPEEAKVISGLNTSSPVRIFYDDYMVPHIYGKTDEDVYRALGFIEARDRFFQMELFRRIATGRLAELVGDFAGLVVQLDWVMRAMNMTPEGKLVYDVMAENASRKVKEVVKAFVGGVNAYIDKIKEGEDVYCPVEFKYLNITPDLLDHWQVRDVYALDRLLTFFLSTTLDEEFLFSAWYVALHGKGTKEEQLLKELLDFRPVAKTPTLPFFTWDGSTPSPFTPSLKTGNVNGKGIELSPTGLESFYYFLKNVSDTLHIQLTGWASNNFVVSGKKSATGHAFLANDPHLELLTPPILYEFHLDSKSLPGATGSLNVAGLSFVGVPAVVIGHNEHLAWGGTFLGYDVTDIYAETITEISGKDYFLHNGKWYPVVHFSDVIKVRSYPSNTFESKTVDFPYIKWGENWHGPLFRLSNVAMTGAFILMTPSGMNNIDTIAIKWTGMIPTDEAEAYIEINHATTYQEFVSAASKIGVGGQNLVFADDKGNIGYAPFALVPVRQLSPGAEPWHIMDGTVDNEWVGWVPLDELPQVTEAEEIEKYNERGFIATANNEQYGESYDNDPVNGKYYLMPDADIGFREERITQLLQKGIEEGKVDLDYLKMVQTDDYSLVGEYFMKLFRERYLNTDEAKDLIREYHLEDALDYLYRWSYKTPTGTGDPFGRSGEDISPQEITDSVASSLFHAWVKRIVKNTLYDELDYYAIPHPFNEWGVKVLYYLLTATSTTDSPTFDPALGYSYLFDNINTPEIEDPVEIIVSSLAEAVNFWRNVVGSSDLSKFRWGILHQSVFIDPFIPFTRGPFPRDGGDFTVNVGKTDSSGTDFTNTHAAVTRFIVELTPGNVHGVNSLPGFNSGRYPQLEPYDQLPLWLHNQYRDMWFYLDEVKGHTVEKLILR